MSRSPHPPATALRLVELLLARLMLAFSMLFVFRLLMPVLEHGMLMAGDDAIHSAYSLESVRLLKEHGRLFDWSYLYGLGEPIYIFRPPGFYLVVALLHALGGGHLAVLTAHKLAYVLALALYPAAIYYLLRKFQFRPLVRGVGALLAFGAISTFGHTLDAYFNLGLAKQAYAILLFPVCLGKLHGIVTNRERVLPGALAFGLMFLNHPYMGWAFCLIGGVYGLVECLAQPDWRWWRHVALRCVATLGGGLAVVAFWLVPFYASEEIQLTSDYSSNRREGFAVVVDTAAGTLRHYVRGSLFDRSPTASPADVFGGESAWAWRPNAGYGRWPVLSWASAFGAVALLARRRRRREVFFVSAWVLAMMAFMGPDDMPWLLHIPFQGQFQFVHFIPIPELFTICLAAYGLSQLAVGAWTLVDRGVGALARRSRSDSRWELVRPALFAVVTLGCVLPFCVNVLQERWAYSADKLRNRVFEVGPRAQTAWSLNQELNRGFASCTDFLQARLGRYERFYGSPTKVQAGAEIFHFSVAPGYLQRTDIISPLFGGLVGGINTIVHAGEFRFGLWNNPVMLDLLRVGAVTLSEPNEVNFPYEETVFRERLRFPRWTVYDAPPSGPCGETSVQPVLFIGSARQWEQACAAWLSDVQASRDRDAFRRRPFWVWERSSRRGREGALPLDQVGAIVVADGTVDPGRFFQPGELERFRAAGRPILMIPSRWQVDRPPWVTEVVNGLSDVRAKAIRNSSEGGARAITTVSEADDLHVVDVSGEQAGFVYFKMAYYRGWHAEVDGVRVANVAMTPGFNACWVPAGTHRVTFRYTGANHARLGWWISAASLLALGVAAVRPRRARGAAMSEITLPVDDSGPRLGARAMVVPVLIGILWTGVIEFRQAVQHVPVPAKPLAGDRASTHPLDLVWNAVSGAARGTQVQVAEDRHFRRLVLDERIEGGSSIRRNLGLTPGSTYFWRARNIEGASRSPWTRTIPFTAEE